jgi:hypothetical protein
LINVLPVRTPASWRTRDAVTNLPSLSACIDVAALQRRTAEPANPVLRARLDAARAKVAVAQYREALPELVAIAGDPAMAKLPALEAEAQQVRAKVLDAQGALADAEQALFRGLVRAQAAHSDALIATIAVDLAHVTGFRSQRTADGLRWADMATAAIAAQTATTCSRSGSRRSAPRSSSARASWPRPKLPVARRSPRRARRPPAPRWKARSTTRSA